MSDIKTDAPQTVPAHTVTVDASALDTAPTTDDEPTLPIVRESVAEHAMTTMLDSEEQSMIDKLAHMERAAEFWKRRTQLLSDARLWAIRETEPESWVLNKKDRNDPDDQAVAIPLKDACTVIAEAYGIQISNVRPTGEGGVFNPVKLTDGLPEGVYQYRAWADGRSVVNGRTVINVEVNRRSDEDFTGRKRKPRGSNEAVLYEGDIRSAVRTALETKITKVLTGTARVPVQMLQRAWKDTTKSVDRCERGHGFGTGGTRRVEQPTEVKADATKLRQEILARTEGDIEAAKAVLREITMGDKPGRDGKTFPGFTSTERMTQAWQIENALKKLKAHPVFGDAAMGKQE